MFDIFTGQWMFFDITTGKWRHVGEFKELTEDKAIEQLLEFYASFYKNWWAKMAILFEILEGKHNLCRR